MLYTKQTIRAMKICYKAHAGQVDRSGVPYVFHPVHVAEQMKDEETTIVALLHDVVEDTKYTVKDLINMGFSEKVTDAIALLTHSEGISYSSYVKNLASNQIARAVKIEDLKHNLDETRLKHPLSETDLKRMEKYKNALSELESDKHGDISEFAGIVHAPNISLDDIRYNRLIGSAEDEMPKENNTRYIVDVERVDDAPVWIATSKDIPGLVVEVGSLDEVINEVKLVVPELLALNHMENTSSLTFRLQEFWITV